MLSLRVNRKAYNVDVEPETPLLWVIRDAIGLLPCRRCRPAALLNESTQFTDLLLLRFRD